MRLLAILLAVASVVFIADVRRYTVNDTERNACVAGAELDALAGRTARDCSYSVSPRPGYALLGGAVVLLLVDIGRRQRPRAA